LLYTSEDRFSWIQDNYIDLLNELQGVSKEAGYEFVLYKESSANDNVVAQIVYIKPNSPAEVAGLKRGDVISKINGQQITTSNYTTLLDATKNNYTINYKPLDVDTQQFGDEKTLSLNVVEYAEDPVYLSKVFNVNDHKIGYFVYNFFATGTDADSLKYDNEMRAVFADFKSQGVTDLILDLRFNSGGSEISANTLSSLVGTGVNSSKVFFKRQYNPIVEAEILNGSSNEDIFKRKFYDEPNNIGSQLNGSTVYVLTGSHTASASELVINALKPYMGVFLIGNTTYGKNVGSMSIYEPNDPKNKWGMQPIIVKAFNSLDQSDYSHGFTPDILNKDNSLLIYPLGDERENLLSAAITQITGVSQPGRQAAGPEDAHDVIGHSLDLKKRSYQLIIDKKITSQLHQ
jgi:C-terminal processing protease CtpA/Prc